MEWKKKMAKLQKKSDGKTNNGIDKKPMDKIHVGFDIKTGCDGYNSIKSIVKLLRAKNYDINDRKIIISLSGETNKKFDDYYKMIHCIQRAAFFNTQRMVEQYNELMWKL